MRENSKRSLIDSEKKKEKMLGPKPLELIFNFHVDGDLKERVKMNKTWRKDVWGRFPSDVGRRGGYPASWLAWLAS
jgi:hypothetical protein